MASGSGEGEDEGGEITVHSSTTAVSDAVALVSPLALEQTLEPYGESIISHAVCVDGGSLECKLRKCSCGTWCCFRNVLLQNL